MAVVFVSVLARVCADLDSYSLARPQVYGGHNAPKRAVTEQALLKGHTTTHMSNESIRPSCVGRSPLGIYAP